MLSNHSSPRERKKQKPASVATESGKHTSVHTDKKTELSRTKQTRLRKEHEMGKDTDEKTASSGSFVHNEQLECEDC